MICLLTPSVGVVPHRNIFLDRCFLGCVPPFIGVLLGLEWFLHSGWTSWPIAVAGWLMCGFLGICLVHAILILVLTISRWNNIHRQLY